MRIEDLLNELMSTPNANVGITPDPTAPEPSPQQQLAQHQKDVSTRKKQIQDQINLLNRQIMDLKKQLSSIT
jgi:hypothetical protein